MLALEARPTVRGEYLGLPNVQSKIFLPDAEKCFQAKSLATVPLESQIRASHYTNSNIPRREPQNRALCLTIMLSIHSLPM